jgi:predicted GH43/DUF377 family glycosyl hydrolase
VIFGVAVLSNCELKETGNPGLDVTSLSDLGATIGTVWENARATELTTSKSGNWDSVEIADPVVMKQGNKFHMWYSGKDIDGEWKIGYASSYDGIGWAKASSVTNPVIDVSISTKPYDRNGARVSSVLYDSSTGLYKMWYRGYDKNLDNTISLYIMYAYSYYPDREWYKHPASETDKNASPKYVKLLTSNYSDSSNPELGSLSVFKEDYYYGTLKKETYLMWYTKNMSSVSSIYFPGIQSAYSNNPSSFNDNLFITYEGCVGTLFDTGYFMPTVIQDYYKGALAYKMWFVSYATSGTADRKGGFGISNLQGQDFTPQNNGNPVLTAGALPQDAAGIGKPSVIRDGDKYKMWYAGISMDGKYTICYKESVSH